MINNNPYNIPQKKPLSQSKIISQTNSSRHSSTYMQNRNGNEVMYSSSIFLKNPSVNGACDQSFFQPIKQPLSPHHGKYSKGPSTVQFIPSYNLPPMRPPENQFMPVSTPKEIMVQKSLIEIREKIEKMEKRLDAREKSSSQIQSKKPQVLLENDSMRSFTEDSSSQGHGLKQMVSLMIEEAFELQNNKIWQKFSQIQQQVGISYNNQLVQKISILQDSVYRLQSQKSSQNDEHLANRLKAIQKTIREMGEDIHLINDKEESLSAKIQIDLPAIKNDVMNLKGMEKKTMEADKKIIEMDKRAIDIKADLQQVAKKINSLQTLTQKCITLKLKEIESKIDTLKDQQKVIKPSFERYLSEPCILKYIQKYQISKPHNTSYSISSKQASFEQIIFNQITYFIDSQGYLLDNHRYYLTNTAKNQRIRLDVKHIDMLKEKKILI